MRAVEVHDPRRAVPPQIGIADADVDHAVACTCACPATIRGLTGAPENSPVAPIGLTPRSAAPAASTGCTAAIGHFAPAPTATAEARAQPHPLHRIGNLSPLDSRAGFTLQDAHMKSLPPSCSRSAPVGCERCPTTRLEAAPPRTLEASREEARGRTRSTPRRSTSSRRSTPSRSSQSSKQQERDEPADDAIFAVDIAHESQRRPGRRPQLGAVTIVEALDFACPYCQRVSSTLDELVKEYDGKVRVVFKNMVVHPQVATTAHLAGCAAGSRASSSSSRTRCGRRRSTVLRSARPVEARRGQHHRDREGRRPRHREVQGRHGRRRLQEAARRTTWRSSQKFQVNSTPSFFINGTHVGGALPKEQFKQIIDEKLKVAEASGVTGAEYYDKESWARARSSSGQEGSEAAAGHSTLLSHAGQSRSRVPVPGW